jgi:DnaJ-class molecular chaperone
MQDYYQLLGLPKNASDEEIKKAYRTLAMKHHPDRGGDSTTFQKIQEAYSVLSDPQERAEYDNPQPQFGPGGPGGFHFNFGPGGPQFNFGGGHPFADIFGGFQRQMGNRPLQLQTAVNLEDAFYGKEIVASIQLPSGREQTINISIPQGIHEGTTLRLSGMGDDSIQGAPRGDILLVVHINDHPVFKRQGDDLLREYSVSAIDAMIGGTILVQTIDGKNLEAKIAPGTQHDTVMSLGGYGMPNFNNPSQRGRLLVKVKISIPTLTEDQKDNLRKLNIK